MSEQKAIKPAVAGAQFGLFAGLACIILSLVLYIISPEQVFSLWFFTGFAIIIVAKIMAVQLVRKMKNGYIVFKEGLQSAFMVSVVSLLVWTIFMHLLIGVIDRSLIDISKKKAIERTASIMERFGAPEDKIEEALDKAEEQDYRPTIMKDTLNYAFSLLVGFFYAVLIAGIFHFISKDKTPVPVSVN